MATLSYTHKIDECRCTITFTYSVTNTDTQTTVKATQYTIGDIAGGDASARMAMIAWRVANHSLVFDGTTLGTGTSSSTALSGSKSITKTHSSQSKSLVITSGSPAVTNTSTTITVGAKTSFPVTYNSTDGINPPAGQTKWFNESLTLQSGIPTRNGYTFRHWNTKNDGTGTRYNPGASYTANARLDLYAIWQQNPSGTVTVLSSTPYYTDHTDYSVRVSDVIVYNDATISSIVLTIGSQSASIDSNNTCTISPLNAAGTFTPIVTIIDSLDGRIDYPLSDIQVNEYLLPSVVLSDANRIVGRYILTTDTEIPAGSTKTYYSMQGAGTNSSPHIYSPIAEPSGNPRAQGWYEMSNNYSAEDDEGTSALIQATFTYEHEIADLSEPILQVDNETDVNNNPKIIWYVDSTLMNPVDWSDASTLPSSVILYGYIDNYFGTQESYLINVIPCDSFEQGEGRTITLQTAFYTVDFRAGGHGIAFGMPAKDDGFHCGMDAHFYNIEGSDGVVSVHLEPRDSYDWNIDHAPANNAYGTGFEIYDSANHRIANLDAHAYPDGAIATVLGVHRLVNDSHVYHQIFLYIDADGTTRYSVNNAAAFREAIGLNKCTTATPTFSDISSGSTISNVAAAIYGKVCTLSFVGVKNSAVAAGGNVLTATLNAGYRPKVTCGGVSYYGASCIIMQMNSSGYVVIRNTGAQLAANSSFGMTLTYVLA